MSGTKNIFVLGLDDYNRQKLEGLPGAAGCAFHPLLEYEQVKRRETYPLAELLEEARTQLRAFGGKVDAVVGYWDFPVTSMVPILCREFQVPGSALESVLRCENKYWSRLEQARVVPEMVPKFDAFDPFDEDPLRGLKVEFPFWMKPIKSFRSYLGFHVANEEEFREALAEVREHIKKFSEPFEYVLGLAQLPREVQHVHGCYCVAEELMHGVQCTVCGYVFDGQARVYGVVDSVKDEKGDSFSHYEYPSRLPEKVRERMEDASLRVVEEIGLDHTAFNIEFFYDRETGTMRLIEINPRISESHCELFEKVDGASDQEIMLDVALGREPKFPRRQGRFACAGKFFLRRYEDAMVGRVPDRKEIEHLQAEIPGLIVKVQVKPGTRLSELADQDSYSYEVADLFVGAESGEGLVRRFHRAAEKLEFDFRELKEQASS